MLRDALFRLLAVVPVVAAAATDDTPTEDPTLKRGAALASQYCRVCHLLPPPSVLDRKTWEQHTLPWMSQKVGLTKVDTDKLPGGKYVREANYFPSPPMLTEDQWKAICHYYLSAAPATPLPQGPRPEIKQDLRLFSVARPVYRQPTPLTTLVHVLPRGGHFFVGDSLRRSLYLLNRRGEEVNSIVLGSPPVSLRMRPGGMFLTLIGYVAPSDDPKGRQLFFPITEEGFGPPEVLLDHLPRPCDTQIADLNGDGREDLVVACFGNLIGQFPWFENLGEGQYREHVLCHRPGATLSHVTDLNRDGLPDILVLMGQAREGVYLYANQGEGKFKETALVEALPVWGLDYLELADFNLDGHPDLVVVNGDNAEYPSPMKNYHGVRIYLNNGRNEFTEAYFYPLNGAYKAIPRDFDADGDLDLAAISFFPDYLKSPEESFVYLENQGNLTFNAHTFPECASGRWIVMDAGDLDGDGDLDLVLGAFNEGPATIPIPASIKEKWAKDGPSVLILKNNLR